MSREVKVGPAMRFKSKSFPVLTKMRTSGAMSVLSFHMLTDCYSDFQVQFSVAICLATVISKNYVILKGTLHEIQLSRISERFFGKNWRWGTLALHEDSTLAWYNTEMPGERHSSEASVGVRLADAPEMIAAGQVKAFSCP